MLDQIERDIAKKLSDKHLYPYALDIYINIFRHFSHYPLNIKDMGIKGPGKTIAFLALAVNYCFNFNISNFDQLFSKVHAELDLIATPYFPQNITVETYLGCLLYAHHPIELKNRLSEVEVNNIFNEKQLYEFNLKKKTLLIFAI